MVDRRGVFLFGAAAAALVVYLWLLADHDSDHDGKSNSGIRAGGGEDDEEPEGHKEEGGGGGEEEEEEEEEESDSDDSLGDLADSSDDEDNTAAGGEAKTFDEAVGAVKKLKDLSNEQKLQLYGLFKQAKEGPCRTPAPSFDLLGIATAKHEAWSQHANMSGTEARAEYVKAVNVILGVGAGATAVAGGRGGNAAAGGGSSAWVKVSTMAKEEKEPSSTPTATDSIFMLSSRGDTAAVLSLIDAGKARDGKVISIDGQDDNGLTALHWACDRRHRALASELLRRGADPNIKDQYGETPLHYALGMGDEGMAEELVKAGADPNKVNSDGQSALSLAGDDALRERLDKMASLQTTVL